MVNMTTIEKKPVAISVKTIVAIEELDHLRTDFERYHNKAVSRRVMIERALIRYLEYCRGKDKFQSLF